MFAAALAKLKDEHELKLTYRAMASSCNFSHSVLAEAARGKRLPPWEVVMGFLSALKISNSEDIRDWEMFWAHTRNELRGGLTIAGSPPELPPVNPSAHRLIPRPEAVRTYDDLIREVTILRVIAGSPSLAEISERMSHRRTLSGRGVVLGKSSLSDILNRRRRPGMRSFLDLIEALLADSYQHLVNVVPDRPSDNVVVAGPVMLALPSEQPLHVVVGEYRLSSRQFVSELARLRESAVKLDARRLMSGESYHHAHILRRGLQLAAMLAADPASMTTLCVMASQTPGIFFADDVVLPSYRGQVKTFAAGGVPRISMSEPATAYALAVAPTDNLTPERSQRRGFIVFAHPHTCEDLFAVEVAKAPAATGTTIAADDYDSAVDDTGGNDHAMASPPWRSLRAWGDAWSAAELNRLGSKLDRNGNHDDEMPLQSEQDAGPLTEILMAMSTERAAAFLRSLPGGKAATVLDAMSNDRAQAILQHMLPAR